MISSDLCSPDLRSTGHLLVLCLTTAPKRGKMQSQVACYWGLPRDWLVERKTDGNFISKTGRKGYEIKVTETWKWSSRVPPCCGAASTQCVGSHAFVSPPPGCQGTVRGWARTVVGICPHPTIPPAPLPTLVVGREAWSISSWVNIVTGSIYQMSTGTKEGPGPRQPESVSVLLSQTEWRVSPACSHLSVLCPVFSQSAELSKGTFLEPPSGLCLF